MSSKGIGPKEIFHWAPSSPVKDNIGLWRSMSCNVFLNIFLINWTNIKYQLVFPTGKCCSDHNKSQFSSTWLLCHQQRQLPIPPPTGLHTGKPNGKSHRSVQSCVHLHCSVECAGSCTFNNFPSAPWSAASPWTLTTPSTLSSHPTRTRDPVSNPAGNRRKEKTDIQKQLLLEKHPGLLSLFCPWEKELFIFISFVHWNFKLPYHLYYYFPHYLSGWKMQSRIFFNKCKYF